MVTGLEETTESELWSTCEITTIKLPSFFVVMAQLYKTQMLCKEAYDVCKGVLILQFTQQQHAQTREQVINMHYI
jgi:hypothetical protein